MILLYLLLGLVFTSLLFFWFEVDCIKCPFYKYLPQDPDLHTYIYLFLWLTWIVSLPVLIITAGHILYKEQQDNGENDGRNKE